MHRFDLNTITATPWKNGGGSTRELACWPPGSGIDAFEWRVSVAQIAHSGPFSIYDGVDRHLMLLLGDGVHLCGPHIDQVLDRAWQPWSFAGEAPLQCELLGGAVQDFNLMLRRGAWRGAIDVVRGRGVACNAQAAGLCMVLAGLWHTSGDEVLTPGQGLWWSSPATLRCAPASDAQCALAWVTLDALRE